MLEAGWLDEIEGLLRRYPPDLKPLQALGYRHLINYLTGRLELGRGLNPPGPGHPALRQAPAHLVFLRSLHPLV